MSNKYDSSRMTAQQLKNSILQMAVQGKLVPQDPNDEPASVLLEKIRAEKAKLVKEKKIKADKNESFIYRGADNTTYEKIGDVVTDISDQIPFDIPEGWEWCRLGGVVEINPRNKIEDNVSVSFIPMTLITEGYNNLHTSQNKLWKDVKSGFTHFAENDVAFAKITPCFENRKSVILKHLRNGYGAGTTELHILRVYNDLIFNEYLLWFCKSAYFIDNGVKAFSGTAGQQRVGKEYVSTCLFPLPPLSEQHRIVAKIEELLPYIDRYDEAEQKLTALNAEFPDKLKKSILQMAVQGKLVPQDSTDEPASVLLDKIRAEKELLIKQGKIKRDKNQSVIYRRDNEYYEKQNGVETCISEQIPFEIPEGWEWCRLGYILNKLSDGTHKTPKYVDRGIPFLSVKDISSGKISFDNTKNISFEEHQNLYSRCNPEFGDILLTKVGTTGIPVINTSNQEFSLFVSVALLKFDQDLLYNEYLIRLIESPLVNRQCTENTKGVGNKNWVMRDIANTLVVIPPLSEQYRIVAKIEEILPLCKKLS